MSQQSEKQTWKSPAIWTGIIAAVIAALATLGGPVVTRWVSQPTPSPSPIGNAGRAATISHTEGKGLVTHTGPTTGSPEGAPRHLAEGSVVYVVCQERDGESLSDPEGARVRRQRFTC
ncbi:hypothetical protein FH608_035780 [Nonomuraea phyllanthi]|uniref:Uncharacterized protein n=1 Tax=Nonomuraea phyllanthi TaxID=2219224 RepID=A0A5C4VVQ2_9ACTN|nr:hypothetical protein [Nonomuraea phyllanthi]KAB8190332.1 hypothetical protein FH608_035780 [Nonomuraea phyllanthi]QFY05575.1 hypothetical protein GBF35_01755 [Nonomuraea phyllanthi]